MEQKTYKGCIFDLDGTLINTLFDLADSVNAALEKHGFPTWETDAYRLKVGRGFRNLMENSVPSEYRENKEVIDSVLADFDAIYSEWYLKKSCPYEGIPALLKTLSEKDIAIAVNSNKRNDYTTKMISCLFPESPFVGVFGDRAGIPKKPDPASALELAGMMRLSPEEVLYIGDSNTDIQTGKNAGMDTIGCAWGFRGRKELEETGATYIAETAEDILKTVMGE